MCQNNPNDVRRVYNMDLQDLIVGETEYCRPAPPGADAKAGTIAVGWSAP